MSAVELGPRPGNVPLLARRAVDLSRDVRVPTDDGAEHLVRLAMGRRDVLEATLAELDQRPSSSDVACAHLLLARAIDLVEHKRYRATPSAPSSTRRTSRSRRRAARS